MPYDSFPILMMLIVLGATVQIGIGIGFSIFTGPLFFTLLGTQAAVPLLLLLNAVVSAVGVPRAMARADHAMITRSIMACVIGIGIGILTYRWLTPAMVLGVAGAMLVLGALVSFLPLAAAGKRAFLPISGLSGLATVWAATPGPLMALGLILAGRSTSETRKLVQPVAFVAYSTAFLMHGTAGWSGVAALPDLYAYLGAAILGGLIGRLIGPSLPRAVIASGIRAMSLFAGLFLLYRALAL